jgi:dihydrofolate synthase/folylpolyglutamate synthase
VKDSISTNVLTPVLSVITNISYDHMDMLGDTIEKKPLKTRASSKTKTL